MRNDLFVIFEWPQVQVLMGYDGFRENSILINDEPLYSEYGDSAYLIRVAWLNKYKIPY